MRCVVFSKGKQCPGTLLVKSDFRTDLGIMNGVDTNKHHEVYVCELCGSVVERRFQWELIGKVDLDS